MGKNIGISLVVAILVAILGQVLINAEILVEVGAALTCVGSIVIVILLIAWIIGTM